MAPKKVTRKIPKTVDAVVFDTYIYRVLKQVHPDIGMTHSSMDTVNNLVRDVLRKVISTVMKIQKVETTTSRTVQNAVRLALNGELAKHAVSEGTKSVTKFNSSPSGNKKAGEKAIRREQRAGLQFSVSRVENVMRSMGLKRISPGAAVYLASVCEYMCAEVLELSGNAAKDHKRKRISRKMIMLAIQNDSELECMFRATITGGGVLPNIHSVLLPAKKPKAAKAD